MEGFITIRDQLAWLPLVLILLSESEMMTLAGVEGDGGCIPYLGGGTISTLYSTWLMEYIFTIPMFARASCAM